MTLRTIAVDWSGAATGAVRKIWLAEAAEGQITRLESGRDRQALADFLILEASRAPDMVVGLDFVFSLPAWFLESRGLADGPALWDLLAREGEDWLSGCEPPFWTTREASRTMLQGLGDGATGTSKLVSLRPTNSIM